MTSVRGVTGDDGQRMSEPMSEGTRDRRPAPTRLDPALAEHEAWRALCQLDERERRGETVAAVDTHALRRHLEARVRAERPDLAVLLPSPGAPSGLMDEIAPARRPAWPLLLAVMAAQQSASGFRTSLRVKPPPAAVAAGPPEVRAPAAEETHNSPVLPPITVLPPPVQPAAWHAAALVRIELARIAAAMASKPTLRQRLADAAIARAAPVTRQPAPPPLPPSTVTAPGLRHAPAATADALVVERLGRLEREAAELEIRSMAMGVPPHARSGVLLPSADALQAPRGIVVDVGTVIDDDGLGLEAGLLHQEEAEVTIIPDNAWRPLRHDADGPGVARHADQAEGPRGLVEEAEVEIVLPGTETEVLRRREAQPTAVGRFLGALTGNGR